MYIDAYSIKVTGSQYNRKSKKTDKNVKKVEVNSVDCLSLREFTHLLQEFKHTHDCTDVIINVELKQHQYEQ